VGGMVIEVPEELKGLGVVMREIVTSMVKRLREVGGGKAVDYAQVERAMAGDAARIERETHRIILQALDLDRAAVEISGKRFARVGRSEATYYTMAGSVVVLRTLYRECGVRNGRTVDPVSLRVGTVADGWLPSTAQAMAHDVQRASSREAAQSAHEHMRLEYSRSSFERVAHEVGALYVEAHADIEDALIEAYEVPADARSITVSLDRVSVPMEEPRPRPAGRPKKGAPKKPVSRNFHMAYCGTVTLQDEEGEALHTIRYGRMPKGDVNGLTQGMAADVQELLRKSPFLKVQLLCDGAPEMWTLLEEEFTEQQLGVEIHKLVDWCHVIEKLSAAARIIYGQDADTTLKRWRLTLLNQSFAAQQILSTLRASKMEYVLDSGQRPVHEAITYLKNHAHLLHFAKARRLGLPIGSGNVEATCKSLFNVRMKRGGARWKEPTGERIVQLRALALSDRWAQAMRLTLRPLRKAVRPAT
jgi:hypothetical protein